MARMPLRLLVVRVLLGASVLSLGMPGRLEAQNAAPGAALQMRSAPLEVSGSTRPQRVARAAPLADNPRHASSAEASRRVHERNAERPLDSTATVRATGSSGGLLLPARGAGAQHSDPSSGASSRRSPIFTALSSLALVTSLLALVVWAARRSMPQAAAPLPGEVVQVLGRAPLAHRQHMHLVRVGNKLLLLCVTPQGAETLTEIVDPAQVEQLAAACERQRPGSISATFKQVLAQVGQERAEGGFLGDNVPSPRGLKMRRPE